MTFNRIFLLLSIKELRFKRGFATVTVGGCKSRDSGFSVSVETFDVENVTTEKREGDTWL